MNNLLIKQIKGIIRKYNDSEEDYDLGSEITTAIENFEAMQIVNTGEYKGSVVTNDKS